MVVDKERSTGTRAIASTRHRWFSSRLLTGRSRKASSRAPGRGSRRRTGQPDGCGRRKGNSPAEIAVSATGGWYGQTARDPVPGLLALLFADDDVPLASSWPSGLALPVRRRAPPAAEMRSTPAPFGQERKDGLAGMGQLHRLPFFPTPSCRLPLANRPDWALITECGPG